MIITRVDNVPGGEDVYVRQWGGGTKTAISKDDPRRSAEEQREQFKRLKKTESSAPDLDS